MPITVTQIRAALEKERQKLARQQTAVDATLAMCAILEQQLEQLQEIPGRPAKVK